MNPDVQSALVDRAERLRASLTERWDEVPHRERAPIDARMYDFPATAADLFPWVAVCFVVDDGRVPLVKDSGHASEWEPPGGKGEARSTSKKASGGCREQGETRSASEGERPARTAERETREETGVEREVTRLLFTETLRFDYGAGVAAPALQAGFLARHVGGEPRPREDAIEAVEWFPTDEVPEGTQFGADIEALNADG